MVEEIIVPCIWVDVRNTRTNNGRHTVLLRCLFDLRPISGSLPTIHSVRVKVRLVESKQHLGVRQLPQRAHAPCIVDLWIEVKTRLRRTIHVPIVIPRHPTASYNMCLSRTILQVRRNASFACCRSRQRRIARLQEEVLCRDSRDQNCSQV